MAHMKIIDHNSIARTERLTGPLDEGFLKTVDFYVSQSAGIFVPTLEHCGYESFPAHTHPAWNFFVHLNQMQVLEDFRTEWADEGLTVTAVPAGLVHTDRKHELNTRYAAVFIDRDFFAREASLYPGEPPRTDRPFCFSVGSDMLNLIKEFIAEYESALPGYDRLLDSVTLRIAHQMLRGMNGIGSGWNAVTERVEINKACDFIHRFYGKKLKVRDLADIAAISESHFAHVFKKETGYSPLDYINMIRIDKGKKLLAANGKSITEIALEVGFSSPSHFSTVFTKLTGMTPAEFRKNGQ